MMVTRDIINDGARGYCAKQVGTTGVRAWENTFDVQRLWRIVDLRTWENTFDVQGLWRIVDLRTREATATVQGLWGFVHLQT